MIGPKYKRIRTSAFLKTGIGMSITGSNDNTVMCEGMTENVELAPTRTAFDDDEYTSKVWMQHGKCFGALGAVAAGVPPAAEPSSSDDDFSVSTGEKGEDSISSDVQGEISLSLDGPDEAAYDDDVMLEDLVKGLDEGAEKLEKEKSFFDSDSD